MIRDFNETDINVISKIWLDTNIEAHDFIEPIYWHNNFEGVKNALLDAEIYVIEDNELAGFIGIMGQYIAGIFIKKEYQKKGMGQKLLDYAKDKHQTLELDVYQKNIGAIKFYEYNGFKIISESFDDKVNEYEYKMKWKRPNDK